MSLIKCVEEIDKLVVLRTNREFMEFMRHHYPDVKYCFSKHLHVILSEKYNTKEKVVQVPWMGAISIFSSGCLIISVTVLVSYSFPSPTAL